MHDLRDYRDLEVWQKSMALVKQATMHDPPSTMLSNGFVASAALCLLAGCAAAPLPSAKVYRCEVVNSFPHDTNAFTQGLVYCDGELYEGTGLNGRSSISRVELETGRVLQQHNLPWRYFGEGITLWGDQLIQLTWTSRTAFLYDRRSFRLLSNCPYPTAGWGLTHDDTRLIMSDGSATLYFREPNTFAETGRIRVTDGGAPVSKLNELEFIRGQIWANVWRRYAIARISPASGQVLSWIDISGLLSPLDRLLAGSPNGIAYDAENDRIFITGKRWPKVFEVRVDHPPTDNPQPTLQLTKGLLTRQLTTDNKPRQRALGLRASPAPYNSESNRRRQHQGLPFADANVDHHAEMLADLQAGADDRIPLVNRFDLALEIQIQAPHAA